MADEVKVPAQGSTDPLAGGKEIKSNQVKFGKPGDYVIGFYQDKRSVVANGKPTIVYQVRGISGQYHYFEKIQDENGNPLVKVDEQLTPIVEGDFYLIFGGRDSIDGGFKKAKVGQKVGMQFMKVNKAKTPGNSPFKLIKFVEYPDMDPELIYDNSDEEVIG